MARETLQIVVDATVKGTKDIEAIGRRMKEMDENARKASEGVRYLDQKFRDSITGPIKNFGKDMAIAGAAVVGVGIAAKQAYDFIGQGAELEAARGRFDNLATSIGVTGDALMITLRNATKGMVSDAELVASASDIISLGLAGTEDDVGRLATVISTLGLDMQQVIMTFANNSTMRLDALGLSVEKVTKRAKELEDQGFVGDAFDEAVLIELEEKMRLLGDASETTAGSMQRFEASLNNTKDAAALAAVELFEAAGGVEQMNLMAATANYNATAGDLRDYGYSWREINKHVTGVKNDFELFRTEEQKVQQQLMAQDGTRRAQIALKILADGFTGTADALGELVDAEIIAQDKAAYYAAGQDHVTTAYGRRMEAAGKMALATELVGNADQVLLQNYVEHSSILEDLTYDYDEFLSRLDLLAIRDAETAERQEEVAASTEKVMNAYRDSGHAAGGAAERYSEMAGELIAVRDGMDDINGREAVGSVRVDGLDSALSKIQALRTEIAKGLGAFSDPYGNQDKTQPDGGKGGTAAPTYNAADSGGARAAGGPVLAGMSYLVGEMGPETFVPNQSGTIVPGVAGPTINIYVNGGRGGMGMAQQVAGAVTDALGRLN